MTDEPRFTLDEAVAELQRRERVAHGHSWDVITTADGLPRRLGCACGVSYGISHPSLEAKIVAVLELATSWECEPPNRNRPFQEIHRHACPGCSRADSIRAALAGG